jgi:hypothetical protein
MMETLMEGAVHLDTTSRSMISCHVRPCCMYAIHASSLLGHEMVA